jgi:hypothetical protein
MNVIGIHQIHMLVYILYDVLVKLTDFENDKELNIMYYKPIKNPQVKVMLNYHPGK